MSDGSTSPDGGDDNEKNEMDLDDAFETLAEGDLFADFWENLSDYERLQLQAWDLIEIAREEGTIPESVATSLSNFVSDDRKPEDLRPLLSWLEQKASDSDQ